MSSTQPADFGILLNIAFGVFKAGLHRHLATAGFDDVGPSFGYVFRLLQERPLNLRQLADHLGITPQGALKVVNDMVAKGYVERSGNLADARVKHLSLTERAARAIAEARRFHAQFEDQLAGRIGREGAGAARAALEDIAAHYGDEGPPALRPL
ncbi:DNA-binding MarR family transcriptional regulator [Oxalobacteraceae bacterium GrIS 1.11]